MDQIIDGSASREADLHGFNGTTFIPARLNPLSRALVIVTHGHHQVHEGNHFVITDVQSVSTTTVKYLVTTPNTTKWPHMVIAFEATGELSILITEGADRTGSTALTAINRNRNSATTGTTTIHRGITDGTTDGATTLFNLRVGATGQGKKTITAGDQRGQNEFILKQNTKYVIAATTYDAVFVSAVFDWYEHTSLAA